MDNKTLVIFVILFLIVSMISLGIFIYYIRNKKSKTEQVLSLLNAKVSQMKNQLDDSKTDHTTSISNHTTSISNLEDKIVSIEENISSLNVVSNSNTNIVQSNLDDHETSISHSKQFAIFPSFANQP